MRKSENGTKRRGSSKVDCVEVECRQKAMIRVNTWSCQQLQPVKQTSDF